MSKPQRIVNIAELALQDSGNGKAFQAKVGRAGPMLGLKKLGCSLTVCRRASGPGQSIAIT